MTPLRDLRLSTLTTIAALAREHHLDAPEDVSTWTVELADGTGHCSLSLTFGDPQAVAGWARILGLPQPQERRRWTESERCDYARPVWMGWSLVKLQCRMPLTDHDAQLLVAALLAPDSLPGGDQ